MGATIKVRPLLFFIRGGPPYSRIRRFPFQLVRADDDHPHLPQQADGENRQEHNESLHHAAATLNQSDHQDCYRHDEQNVNESP